MPTTCNTSKNARLFGDLRHVRKQNVVALPTVEGRVKVHKVNCFVLHVAPQHVEIVAVIEFVFGHRPDSNARAWCASVASDALWR